MKFRLALFLGLGALSAPVATASAGLAQGQPDREVMQPTRAEANWPQLDYAKDGNCEGEVRGNGKFFRFYIVGLSARENARFQLTNTDAKRPDGDMKPIDWRVRADRIGEWSKLFIPFMIPMPMMVRREGGEVAANFSGETCNLSLSFYWQRGIRVID